MIDYLDNRDDAWRNNRITYGDRERAIDVLGDFAECIPGIRELNLEKT